MRDSMQKILVIDDDDTTLQFMQRALPEMGLSVITARSGDEGIMQFKEARPDIVIVDIKMPKLNGFEVLSQLRSYNNDVTAIVVTGYGSIDSAVLAIKAGAIDYLTKPFELDHLEIVVTRAIEYRKQKAKLRLLESQIEKHESFEGLVGICEQMQHLYSVIRKVSEKDTTILIQGETGTGKELVARAIHHLSKRANQVLMPINCGALPESLLESELFGHEKGSFTGAFKQKFGLIEQASGGTLFLDEIDQMSPALQVKLLRAIQEREVLRIGGAKPVPVDFRLITATNKNLRDLMEEGTFRKDLFYRLSVVVLDLPPLRDRGLDIPLLVNHFIGKYAERKGSPVRAHCKGPLAQKIIHELIAAFQILQFIFKSHFFQQSACQQTIIFIIIDHEDVYFVFIPHECQGIIAPMFVLNFIHLSHLLCSIHGTAIKHALPDPCPLRDVESSQKTSSAFPAMVYSLC